MIYTIGNKDSYERYLFEQGDCKKKGRDGDYDGGSVWNDAGTAASHAPDGYAVYGVLAEWGRDTEPSRSGGDWHDLLSSATLVRLEVQPTSG